MNYQERGNGRFGLTLCASGSCAGSQGRVKEALHLKSGNLVAILGLTTNKNTRVTYLVTELMALGSLHNVLQGEAQAKVLDHSSEINIASNLVSGMHYLHLSKPPFIHGAIRAKHVFLDEKLTAKVCQVSAPIA